MTRWSKPVIAAVAALSAMAALSSPSQAHHSTSMFDKTKERTLTGFVTEFQWTNPHIFIEMEAMEGGAATHYSIEGGTTRTMERMGWKVRTLKPGDKVSVVINPMRNGTRAGMLVSATLADGRLLQYDPTGG